MSIDRFVDWQGHGPGINEVRKVLEDYLGAGSIVAQDGAFLTATLPGKPSFPFRRMDGYEDMAAASEQHSERFLEVHVNPKGIDVITRLSDELTCVIADGFVTLAARFWKGRRRIERER